MFYHILPFVMQITYNSLKSASHRFHLWLVSKRTCFFLREREANVLEGPLIASVITSLEMLLVEERKKGDLFRGRV